MEEFEAIVNPTALVVGNWMSAAFIAVVIAVAVMMRLRGRSSSSLPKLLFIFTCTTIALAFVLTASQGFAFLSVPLDAASFFRCLFDAIHDTLQVISLDGSARVSLDNLQPVGWSPSATWNYLIWQSVLFVAAPATTFGSVAYAGYKMLSSPLLWLFTKRRDTYVFSEANSSAITLAKSIIAHYKSVSAKPVIAFAEIDHADETIVDEAHALKIVCSGRSIDELSTRCSPFTKRWFIFSSENEAQNLEGSLRLTETLMAGKRRRAKGPAPTVVVFSTSSLSDGFGDAAVGKAWGKDGPVVHFRRYDHVQNTINQVLMERPVFLNASLAESCEASAKTRLYGCDQRRILVVGAGTMGFAFLKGAIWASQSNLVGTHIDVIESNGGRKRRLALECPEIHAMLASSDPADAEATATGQPSPASEAYDIEFHDCDVFSDAFDTYMREHGHEVSYVFVALGDDLASAQAARRVREMLERGRLTHGLGPECKPPIVAVIDDSLVANTLANATTSKGQTYEITPVGTLEALFSYENVFQPRLDRWARNLNAAYWGYYDQLASAQEALAKATTKEELEKAKALADGAAGIRTGANNDYDKFEYNRISSRASAIFLKHHLFEFCRGIASGAIDLGESTPGLPSAADWAKPADDPAFKAVLDAYGTFVASEDRREPLLRLEHLRWNAFMRTLGYERCDETTLKAINERAKKKTNLDHLARLHICLVPFDDLDEVDEMFHRVTGETSSYKHSDDVIVTHLAEILTDGR